MLTGERVVLRPFTPDDVEPLWRAKLDPLKWAQTTEAPLTPVTLEEQRSRYAEASKDHAAQFAVDVDGELVGRGGLFNVDDLARNAELGLALLPEHQGKGYGKDVLRAYRAVGFVEEGRQREHAWVEGAYEDMVLMSILRSEWTGLTPDPHTRP